VGLDMDKDIQIAGRASIDPGLTFAREAQSGSVIHTGRNFYGNLFPYHCLSGSPTLGAGMGYALTVATACRTGCSHCEKALGSGHLAVAATLAAGFRRRSGFAAITAAAGANFHFFNIYFSFCSKRGVHEAETHIVSEISALPCPGPGASAVGTKSKKIFKDITETRKDVLEPTKSGEASPFQPLMAILIVEGTFLGIPQDLIRFGGLFELLLGFFIPGIPVRVVFEGKFPVG